MNFYFDTEYLIYEVLLPNGKMGKYVDLISIGAVDEWGCEFYRVSADFDLEKAGNNPWIVENVLKHISPQEVRKPLNEIRQELWSFVDKSHATFHYWKSPYDAVLLLSLLDIDYANPPTGFDLPVDVSRVLGRELPNYPKPRDGSAHNALYDASWLRNLDQNFIRQGMFRRVPALITPDGLPANLDKISDPIRERLKKFNHPVAVHL